MGTFTLSYCIKTLCKKYKWRIMLSPISAYLLYFYYQNCVHKREMMRGQSRLYAERRAEIQAWAKKTGQEIDIWRY